MGGNPAGILIRLLKNGGVGENLPENEGIATCMEKQIEEFMSTGENDDKKELHDQILELVKIL